MAYKLSKNIRIDLSHLGEDAAGSPFFVEIKNSKMMTYDEKMSFVSLLPKNVEGFSPEAIKGLKDVAGSFIVTWNLTSLVDDSPVQIPRNDPDALSKVPSIVIESIMNGITAEIKKDDQATKNSLPQSDKSSENDRLPETLTSADTTN